MVLTLKLLKNLAKPHGEAVQDFLTGGTSV